MLYNTFLPPDFLHMNRDAVIATIVGFAIGLVITGVFLLGPTIVRYFPSIHLPNLAFLTSSAKPTPTPTPPPVNLAIDAPLPDSIEPDNTVLVSGTSPAHSLVVIEGTTDEALVTANGDGKYAGKISLSEGKNDVLVTSYKGTTSLHQSVVVFYTPEKF